MFIQQTLKQIRDELYRKHNIKAYKPVHSQREELLWQQRIAKQQFLSKPGRINQKKTLKKTLTKSISTASINPKNSIQSDCNNSSIQSTVELIKEKGLEI